MAWSTHPSVVTGQTWSASDENTYVKGNLDTLWPYTAAQQVAYSTSATEINKATASAALQVLRVNTAGTSIEFGSMPVIYRRQGNSTSNWYSTSTSTTLADYAPTSPVLQVGSVYTTSGSTRSVTFPSSFSSIPIVFTPQAIGTDVAVDIGAVTVTGFTYRVYTLASTLVLSTANYQVVWMAVGEI